MADASASAVDAAQKKVGFKGCLPHLSVRTSKLAEAIAFYKNAFDAAFASPPRYSSKRKADQQEDAPRLLLLGHLKFGSAEFLISEMPEKEDSEKQPADLSDGANLSTNVVLHVLAEDVEGAVEKAKAAGAIVLQEPETSAVSLTMVSDPAGFVWAITDTILEEDEGNQQQEGQLESKAELKK